MPYSSIQQGCEEEYTMLLCCKLLSLANLVSCSCTLQLGV